jgi:hypothetical protein
MHIASYFCIHPIPYFMDLKVLLSGIDVIRQGLNPYSFDYDLAAGSYNYPYAWGVFSIFPFITESNHMVIGFSLATIVYTLLYFHIGRCDLLAALTYTLLLISPAIMLGFERGNCDLIIFIFLILPLFFRGSKYLFSILLLFSAALKIFPFGAIIVLLNNLKTQIKATFLLIVGITIFFISYCVLYKEVLITVSNKTPRPYGGISYGLGEIPSKLIDLIHTPNRGLMIVSFILLVVTSLGLFCYYIFKKSDIPEIEDNKSGSSYLIGTGIFLTSCLIGHNWEYRLLFLLFTIPQIMSWIRNKNQFSILILVSTIIITWQSMITNIPRFLGFGMFTYYHYISQLIVVFLFLSHASILFVYFKSFYKKLVEK